MTVKKNKPNILFTAAIGLLAVALIFGIVYFFAKPGTHSGSKKIQIEVIDNNGQVVSYNHTSDSEFLSEVFDEIDDLSVEGDTTDMGFYITSVNGLTADYNKDKSYWAILVNGDYGNLGASSQPIVDGDTYSLVYTIEQ